MMVGCNEVGDGTYTSSLSAVYKRGVSGMCLRHGVDQRLGMSLMADDHIHLGRFHDTLADDPLV